MLLAIVMVVGMMPGFALTATAATTTGITGECTWTFDDTTGTLTISGIGAIAANAFSGRTDIVSLVIEDGVKSIGGSAFYGCTSLTTVTIPGSVTAIGGYAFSGCTSLTTVNYLGKQAPAPLPSSAFAGTSLKNVKVPADYEGDKFAGIDVIKSGGTSTPEAKWGASADSLTNEGTLAEAIEAADIYDSVKYIQLQKDLSGKYVISDGVFTLDLNGKTLTGSTKPLSIQSKGTEVTLKNGTVISTYEGSTALYVGLTAKVIIENGTYEGGAYALAIHPDSEAEIRYGTFTSDQYAVTNHGTLTISGGTFHGETRSTILTASDSKSTVITGGTFIEGGLGMLGYEGGLLDLSGYANVSGITVYSYVDNVTVGDTNIKLPAGYILSKDGTTVAETLEKGTVYTVIADPAAPPTPTITDVIISEKDGNGAVTVDEENQTYAVTIPENADEVKITFTVKGTSLDKITQTDVDSGKYKIYFSGSPSRSIILMPSYYVSGTGDMVGTATLRDIGTYAIQYTLDGGTNKTSTGWTLVVRKAESTTPTTYTVTFDVGGKSDTPTPQTVAEGGMVTKPTDPVPSIAYSEHKFVGWYKEAECVNAWNFETDTVTGNITLYAKWTASTLTTTFTVTFDANGHGTAPDSQTVTVGRVTKPADPIADGYTFGGWYTDRECTDEYLFNGLVSHSFTLYAKWTVNQYTITFDTDGGSEIAPITQDYGTAVEAPADPAKTGYTFAGWDADIPTTMPADNLTITAKWTVNQYTVTFYGMRNVLLDEQTVNYGEAAVAPAPPEVEGYRFVAWNDTSYTNVKEDLVITAVYQIQKYPVVFKDWNGDVLKSEDVLYGNGIIAPKDPVREGYTFTGWSPEVPGSMPDEPMTFTAQYSASQYTIKWIVDGAETTETYAYGAAVTAPADPTKTGYTFAGWDVAIPTTMPAGNLTITAQWTINQYTITFDTDGGTEIAPITQDYGTAVEAPADPTKTGYIFAGWGAAVPGTMPAENLTFTAKWTVNQYTITFNTDGGTEIAPITQDYGTAVEAPAAPVKTGYTFAGWDVAIPTTMPAGNLTITAQWTINQYTITFNTDGGTEIAPITQDYGTDVEAPADPAKTGYTFAGWDVDIPTTMPAENLTITAKWTANQYTITFNTDGGTEIEPITQDYGTDVEAPADPVKTGYTFAGWDADIPTTMPAGNLTITAQWTINQHTISFNSNGGSDVAPITQDYGTAVEAPEAPTKLGYKFVDWYVDAELTTVYEFTTMPAEDVTVYAKWVRALIPITPSAGSPAVGEDENGKCSGDQTCPMSAFEDLDRNAWYHAAVHYCLEEGLMNGVSDTEFAPGMDTSRAMIVTILWRLEGKPVVNYLMGFEDVAADQWYTEAIRWAASEGIVNGYSETAFGPDDAITREQLATILYRYEQYKGGGFTGAWMIRMDYVDLAEVSDWAYEAMCWMNMNGIVNGKPGKVLDPKGNASRAEAAAMLQRYCTLP